MCGIRVVYAIKQYLMLVNTNYFITNKKETI